MNVPKQSVPVSRDAIPSKALNQRGIAASVISFSADRFIDTQNNEQFTDCVCNCQSGTREVFDSGGKIVQGRINSDVFGSRGVTFNL
jgi:hypothetical protein